MVVQRCLSVTNIPSLTEYHGHECYSVTGLCYSDVLGGAQLISSMGEQGECYTVTVLQKCEYSDVLGGELYNAPHKQHGRAG